MMSTQTSQFEGVDYVKRYPNYFYPDVSRVITLFFLPGPPDRVYRTFQRILRHPLPKLREMYQNVLKNFAHRHRDVEEIFKRHYYLALQNLPKEQPFDGASVPEEIKLLIGSYFTKEYSVEAAAFFNPSIIPHPDQTGVPEGGLRFIISFRAVGEGHVSSIVFRTGLIDAEGELQFHPVSPYVATPKIVPNPNYDKRTFWMKLGEMSSDDQVTREIMEQLPDTFTYKDLEDAIWIFGVNNPHLSQHSTIHNIKWLAQSNYQIEFAQTEDISEQVIFPYSTNESRGIEDARFVQFRDGDEITYYATYTAFNGHTVLPQMLETQDFCHFKILTLNGSAAKNKGMALFPRKLNGRYYMIGRIDGENLYIMMSDHLHFWNEAKILQVPRYLWDLVTIGNCGSPIETEEGWLLFTHGVGPMRRYCISAMLLDLENPARVRAYLNHPLMEPLEKEREGYVPNVVYSCGAIRHNGYILLPYAMSDSISGFATIDYRALMDDLLSHAV